MLFTKKIIIFTILGTAAYLTSNMLLHFSATLAPDVVLTTTTTTTPTPLQLLLNKSQVSPLNITIEKYDALKVHLQIMKEKIKRMTGHSVKLAVRKMNYTDSKVHMLYYDKIRHIIKKKNNSTKNLDQMMLLENLKMAQSIGAGVLIFPHPYVPISPQTETSENILNTLLNIAPMFNLSISIIIRENMNRNILSIRRDIFHFMEAYKNHPSVYKYKRNSLSKALPVIYVMESYMIPYSKWKELLSVNGQLTIRNSDIDALILGQLQDEEHDYHIRQSNFDGFFTCCMNNGESFGNTWKNWQSLSVWSRLHDLMWSTGVNEGPGGILSVKTALNTLLRCRTRPKFIFVNNVQFRDDYISLFQTWMEIWLNNTVKNKYL